MDNDLMFSSKTCEWETPQELFNKLDAVFHFQADVCANKDNAKCANFYSKEENGLAQDWLGTCWMNPPYGKGIYDWVKKAYQSAKDNNATVVCLLPARTDTKWWHEFCLNAEVYFIKGRLKFGDATNSAPFPSAIVIFRPQLKDILG
jgi:phage N-6-adenine-methyltransferase